jgi:hypothetical protein
MRKQMTAPSAAVLHALLQSMGQGTPFTTGKVWLLQQATKPHTRQTDRQTAPMTRCKQVVAACCRAVAYPGR